ncbi:MAG: hypothetical protein Q4G39_05910, partial [Brachymonas sp.]|nr:hypothetical protein [Brachymonas sp.]
NGQSGTDPLNVRPGHARISAAASPWANWSSFRSAWARLQRAMSFRPNLSPPCWTLCTHRCCATTQTLSMQAVDAERNSELFRIENQEKAADHLLTMGRITNTQRLEMQQQYENERYQIELKAVMERMALAEKENNLVEIEKLNEKKLELERKYQQKLTEIRFKQEKEKAEPQQNIFKGMESALNSSLQAMLTRTQTFRQAMQNLFKGITNVFAQEASKMLSNWAMTMLRKSVIGRALGLQEMATEQQTSALKIGLAQGASAAQIAAIMQVLAAHGLAAGLTVGITEAKSAAEMGAIAPVVIAETVKSQAGIPIVGPALALAAAAAMMAFLGGLGGKKGDTTTTTVTRIPSAAGGWDIPAGINPLTQLHEREMVLPAAQADAVRRMADGGQTSGEAIVINATGGDWIHKRDLAKLLKTMKRDYRFA